jgi:hypothetical protein
MAGKSLMPSPIPDSQRATIGALAFSALRKNACAAAILRSEPRSLPRMSGTTHRLVETDPTARAMCSFSPSVRSPGSNRAKRTLALRARRAMQQHDYRHQSGEQSSKRKPIQPKAIGRKHCRQNTKSDAWKHEQHGLISTSLQIIPYRHRLISYRVGKVWASA